MYDSRDDMVIRPSFAKALGKHQTPAQRRRNQSIQEAIANRVKRRYGQVIRRMAVTRQAARFVPSAVRSAAAGGGSKLLGAVGVGIAAVEAVLVFGRAARRIQGKSGRLIAAEDANSVWGGFDEEVTARAMARSELESRPNVLRMIGQQNGVNSSIADMATTLNKFNLRYARGADMIEREPYFDSNDTLVDQLIAKAKELGLGELARRAAQLIKRQVAHTFGARPGYASRPFINGYGIYGPDKFLKAFESLKRKP